VAAEAVAAAIDDATVAAEAVEAAIDDASADAESEGESAGES
jgi:hypothetical protein